MAARAGLNTKVVGDANVGVARPAGVPVAALVLEAPRLPVLVTVVGPKVDVPRPTLDATVARPVAVGPPLVGRRPTACVTALGLTPTEKDANGLAGRPTAEVLAPGLTPTEGATVGGRVPAVVAVGRPSAVVAVATRRAAAVGLPRLALHEASPIEEALN